MARMIGRARKEFDNATREFQSAATGLQNGTGSLFASLTEPVTTTSSPRPPLPGVRSAFPVAAPVQPTAGAKTGDELLIEAARRLGISTQGKTREQIQEEIIALAQRPPSPAGSAPAPKKDDSVA